MESKKCPGCGQAIQGRLEFIRASVMCLTCCMKSNNRSDTSTQGCFFSIPESYALTQCGCSISDLAKLKHVSLVDLNGDVVAMYLRGEVRYLRNLRRKVELERSLGISLKRLDWKIRRYLLGDYLTQLTHCQTPLKKITERRCVLSRVRRILKKCPFAHPDAVFDFCVSHPGAGALEFQHLKEKLQRVFRLEGRRILCNIPKSEREKLKSGPLEDVLNDYGKHDSDALVWSYLRQWFSDSTVSEIMADPVWRKQPWAEGPEDRTAFELKRFWNEKMERLGQLMDSLNTKHLTLPKSCSFCKDYLNGEGSVSLKVLVAIVDLKKKLADRNIDAESAAGEFGIGELMYSMEDTKMRHCVSVYEGLQAALFMDAQSSDDLDDENADDSGDEDNA